METLTASLNSLSSTPTSSRSSSYLEILKSILLRPRSKLSSNELKSSLSKYLEITAFSDLNSAGGGLVVGRQVLNDFLNQIKQVTQSKSTSASNPLTQSQSQDDTDTEMSNSTTVVNAGADEDEGDHVPAIRDLETKIAVLQDAIDKTSTKVLSFEEQATELRLFLAEVLENSEDWGGAANTLSGISLESSHRSVSDLQKLRIYVRIARLHLEDSSPVDADVFLKRASMLLHSVPGAITKSATAALMDAESSSKKNVSKEDLEEAGSLGLQYKLCQAKVYDSQKRFNEASLRFHELSYLSSVDEEERGMMLSAAVTCAILAPAGPHRSRLLSTLIRDERTSELPQFTILTKVFLEQIIRPKEIESFEKLLAPHQRALLPPSPNEKALLESIAAEDERRRNEEKVDDEVMKDDTNNNTSSNEIITSSGEKTSTRMGPSTVLDRSMMEHNLLAASKLYENITLKGLGILLNLSSGGSEALARRMISQKRLKAEIDQVDGILIFLDHGDGNHGDGPSTGQELEKENQDAAAGGGVGGEIGDEELSDPKSKYTKIWDSKIAKTVYRLEDICQRLTKENLLPIQHPAAASANNDIAGNGENSEMISI